MAVEVLKTKTDDEGCEYRLAVTPRGAYNVFYVVKGNGKRRDVLYDVIGGTRADYDMSLERAREVFEQCGTVYRCAEQAKALTRP